MRASLAPLVALALLATACAPLATAATAGPVDQVTVEYRIVFDSPREVRVALDADVARIQHDGRAYTAEQVRDDYARLRAGGGEAAAERFIEGFETRIRGDVEANLRATFPDATVAFREAAIDRATLQAVPASAPLGYAARVNVSSAVASTFTDAQLATAFRAGATYRVDAALAAPAGYRVTFSVQAPQGLAWRELSVGSVSADGGTATFLTNNQRSLEKADVRFEATLHDPRARAFSSVDRSLTILVDMEDLDVSVAKAAAREPTVMSATITVEASLRVVEVPPEAQGAIPPQATLRYLSSDALRAFLRDGLVAREDLRDIESRLLDTLADELGAALGDAGAIRGGFDPGTLAATAGDGPFDAERPIVFRASLPVKIPLSGGASASAASAIAVYTVTKSFSLPPVEGFDTTYKLVFPPGLAVRDASATNGRTTTGEEDGREFVLLTPTGDAAARTTVAIAMTPAFVASKFAAELVVVGLLLALIFLGVVALVVRRARGRRARARRAASPTRPPSAPPRAPPPRAVAPVAAPARPPAPGAPVSAAAPRTPAPPPAARPPAARPPASAPARAPPKPPGS